MLMQFETAFTHQFKRGGKTRGQHRRPLRRLHQIFDQVLIERTPIERAPDQPLDRLINPRVDVPDDRIDVRSDTG